MPLDMKKPHTIFGGQHGSPTVLQHGVLWTMSGKRLPDGVPAASLGGYHIPDEYRYLLKGPKVEDVLKPMDHGPQIDGFSEAEVRQALLMLKLLKAKGEHISEVDSPATVEDLVFAGSDETPVEDSSMPDLIGGIEEFIEKTTEDPFETQQSRGVIHKQAKGLTGKTKILVGRKPRG